MLSDLNRAREEKRTTAKKWNTQPATVDRVFEIMDRAANHLDGSKIVCIPRPKDTKTKSIN